MNPRRLAHLAAVTHLRESVALVSIPGANEGVITDSMVLPGVQKVLSEK